jgi:hypothetical protein
MNGRFAVRVLALATVASVACVASVDAVQHHYFTITVINKLTGLPIPGLTATTNLNVGYVSDANGKLRFYEPGLMTGNVLFSLGDCPPIPAGQTTAICTNPSGGATTCTTDADCNLGYVPVLMPLFQLPGMVLTMSEQGQATLRLCPAGGGCTSDLCYVGPFSPCTPLPPAPAPTPNPSQMFKITVVDPAAGGRGVPLVEVKTSTQTYITDSAGVVAFYDPARMGTSVHFDLTDHGYTATSADLVATAGGSASVPMTRTNVAERLYRITGAGIYRDTVLLEQPAPLANPVLNAQVIGSDSVLSAVYQGKAFFVWGDTGRMGALLGTFRAPGATALLPPAGLDPSVGINLDYFPNGNGFVAEMCPDAGVPAPPGYTPGQLRCWMGGLTAVPDAGGTERLLATYSLGVGFTNVKSGWAQFNDSLKYFQQLTEFGGTPSNLILGYPHKVRHGATTYAYGTFVSTDWGIVGDPPVIEFHPMVNPARTLATVAGLTTSSSYEGFTPFQQGSDTVLEYNPDGTLKYSWKTNTRVLNHTLPVDPTVPADQKLYGHIVDPSTGGPIYPLSGSVQWNAHRQRFVALSSFAVQHFLEADTPMGPWVYSRKVLEYENYGSYGTRHHAFFDKSNGREIFFESTYTTFFSAAPAETPWYNYNQIMYKLDLDTPAIVMPVPVYDLSAATTPGNFVTKKGLRPATPDSIAPFMAPDRAGMANTVPVWWNDAACKQRALVVGGTPATTPVFWALPGNAANPPPTTVPLYDYVNAGTGAHAYSVDGSLSLAGFTRVQDPIARVWANPMHVKVPVHDYLPALIADAGVDRCVVESSVTHLASVQLNATQTTGTPSSYAWSWSGGSASGATPTVNLPVGLHNITLTTTGSDGSTSTDDVVIRVDVCISCC